MSVAERNVRVFAKMLKARVDDEVKPKLIASLNEVAEWMVKTIEGNFEPFFHLGGGNDDYPVWYGHLRDATGVGVYVDGHLTSYKPTKRALDSPQHHGSDTNIVGSERLEQALQEASGEFAGGIWIVLFSAVPYAYNVNTEGSPRGRGVDFFDSLADTLKISVFSNLEPIGIKTSGNNLFN